MKPEFFDKMGEYVFSKSELADMNAAIVRNNLNVERTLAEIAHFQQKIKEAKANITAINADSMAKSHSVRDGKENRLIQCQMIRDFATKQRVYFSVETGDTVATESFTRDDFQLEIPFEEGGSEGSAEVFTEPAKPSALELKRQNPHFDAGYIAFGISKESGLEVINTPDLPEDALALWTEGFKWARGDFDGAEKAEALIDFSNPEEPTVLSNGTLCSKVYEIHSSDEGGEGMQALTDIYKLSAEEINAANEAWEMVLCRRNAENPDFEAGREAAMAAPNKKANPSKFCPSDIAESEERFAHFVAGWQRGIEQRPAASKGRNKGKGESNE